MKLALPVLLLEALLVGHADAGSCEQPALHAPAGASAFEDWWVYATFGVFPEAPLQSFTLGVHFSDSNYGYSWDSDPTYCEPLVEGATVSFDGGAVHFEYPEDSAGYIQSRNVLRCNWYSHEPALPAEAHWFQVTAADARDADGQQVPASICMTAFQTNPEPDTPLLDMCGDADSNGRVAVPDALRALQRSSGLPGCSDLFCDVDRSGDTSAADALRILRAAIGIEQALLCAGPCIE